MREVNPEASALGQRLDAWLATLYPACSKATLRAYLKRGAVTLKGRPCDKGDRVCEGVYCFSGEPQEATLAPNASLPLEIVYEDEVLIAVNKPAGMDCQPNAPTETETLGNALLAYCPSVAGVGDSALTCGILHRIDGDTSGLVLVAKTQAVYTALRAQFSDHTVEKHYLALVTGTVRAPIHLEHSLAHNPRCPGRMIDATLWRDAKRPMRAVTDAAPNRHLTLSQHPMTLLDVTIFTGVTHQIRAQLSLSGLPILGDKRYGGFQLPGFNRHFLHAHTATFVHPTTQRTITLTAPLTKELLTLLNA